MKLPRLNRLLALEEAQRTPDGAGGFTEVWTELGQLWGEITSRTGRERSEAEVPLSTVGVRIVYGVRRLGHHHGPSRNRGFAKVPGFLSFRRSARPTLRRII